MKNKNTHKYDNKLAIVALMLVGIPIITAVVIIALYYIDGLGNLFTYI